MKSRPASGNRTRPTSPPRGRSASGPVRRSRSPSCPSDEELAGFIDGSLTAAERVALEAHLDECALCRAAFGHVTAAGEQPERAVGRYRLEEVLGHGGMGVVWRAWDPALEREVAVKLLHPELHDERWRQRALREARALARLQHPNVIAVHDVGEVGGELFIATELIDGEPLDRWQRGRSAPELLAAYAQAARGLAAAHAIGLVHRDVKPNNILVSRSGRVCVGDFGLATSAPRVAAPPPELIAAVAAAGAAPPPRLSLPRLTGDGIVLGTPAYMAPEQRGTSRVDARADQYALCLALAEALLGRRPLDGTSAADLAASGVAAPWPAIARGLALRPEDRFPDLAPIIEALEAAAPTRREAPSRAVGRGPLRALAAAAVALAIALAAWLAVFRRDDGDADAASARAAAQPRATAAPAVTPPPPSPPSPPSPPTWIASAAGPWRLSAHGRGIALLDDRRAAVTTWPRQGQHRLMLVELASGATTPPRDVVPAGDAITLIRRVGDRALAFGRSGRAAERKDAIWHLSGDPLTAVPLPVAPNRDDPRAPREEVVLVSPDGDTFLWCTPRTTPTLRSARTLAVVRTLAVSSCGEPRFTAADRLLLGDREVNLRTGAVRHARHVAGTPRHFAGPLGRVLTVSDETLPVGVVRNADVPTQREFAFSPPFRWTPDGVAISMTDDRGILLRPDRDGNPRTAKISAIAPLDSQLDVDANQAVLLEGAGVEHVDLRSGARRGADGNLGSVVAVLPHRGGVISLADQLRSWRAGAAQLTEPLDGELLAAVPALSRIAVLDRSSALWLWDPETNQRRKLTEGRGLMFAPMAARRDQVWLGVEGAVLRSTAGGPAERWLSFPTRLLPAAIDPAGRIAWLDDRERLHLGELATRRAHSFALRDDCRVLPDLALGAGLLAVSAEGRVVVTSGGAAQRPSLPADHYEIAIASDGALWLAGSGTLISWRLGEPTATLWPTGVPDGARATAIAIDPSDRELAIGYNTGAVVYVTAALARARGASLPVTLADDADCLVPEAPIAFDELVRGGPAKI